jgi:hypothetical protein
MVRVVLPIAFALATGCSSLQRSIRDARASQPDQIRYAIVEEAAAHWPSDTVVCLSFGKDPVTDKSLSHIRGDAVTAFRESDCGDWRHGNEPRFERFVGLEIEGIEVGGDRASTRATLDTRSGSETRIVTLARHESGEWRVVKKEAAP